MTTTDVRPEVTSTTPTDRLLTGALLVAPVVYLDHPDNPKPARSSERDYGRFGSYFVADVTKDKPLKVKYRLWIQPGEMTVEQCEAAAKALLDLVQEAD